MCAKPSHDHKHSFLFKRMEGDKTSKLGSLLAVGCAIHCMATPLLIAVVPSLFSGFLNNPWFEILLMASSLLLTGVPIYRNYKGHKNLIPFGFLALAALIFILNHAFESLIPTFHTPLNISVGVFILIAVLMDRKMVKERFVFGS